MSGLEGGNDEVTDHEELLTEGGASAGSLHAAALPNGAPMSAHAVISRPLQIPAMSAVMHSAQHDLQQQHQQHRLLQIQLLRQQLLQRQPSRQTPFSYDYTSLLGPTQPTPQQFNAWNAPAHELHQSLPFALPSQATQSYNSSTETNPLPTAARPSFGTSEEVPLASLFIASRAGQLQEFSATTLSSSGQWPITVNQVPASLFEPYSRDLQEQHHRLQEQQQLHHHHYQPVQQQEHGRHRQDEETQQQQDLSLLNKTDNTHQPDTHESADGFLPQRVYVEVKERRPYRHESFPEKLYRMIREAEESGMEHVLSWTSCGKSFEVHDIAAFEQEIIPHYFRHSRFASFRRQLNMYGFKRVTASHGKAEFANTDFHRDRPEDCAKLKRVSEIQLKLDPNSNSISSEE